jgi:hypothetical protein
MKITNQFERSILIFLTLLLLGFRSAPHPSLATLSYLRSITGTSQRSTSRKFLFFIFYFFSEQLIHRKGEGKKKDLFVITVVRSTYTQLY